MQSSILYKCLGLVVAVAVVAASVQITIAADRPNVVIVMADDMGYSDLGCYGGEIETPRLDQLAAGGVRFTQFYNTGRCWPTRASLLTGYYAPQVHRDTLPDLGWKDYGVRGVRPAWGQLVAGPLRRAGYRTYHSGKWHIDGMPTENAFDRSYYTNDYNHLFRPSKHYLDDAALPPVGPEETYYSTDAITSRTIEFLSEHQTRHSDQPFFAYVALMVPHFPLQAPAETIAKYHGRYDAGWDVLRDRRMVRIDSLLGLPAKLSPLEPGITPPNNYAAAVRQLGPGEVAAEVAWKSLTPVQREFQTTKMEIHAAMVDRMDQNIGRLVDHLRDAGQLDNTLFLFLSDNGASAELMIRGGGHDPDAAVGSDETYLCLGPAWGSLANAPFRRHKHWTHEGGISTPLIAHWPAGLGEATRGTLRRQISHVIDLTPTVLQLAGSDWDPHGEIPDAPPRPGISLLPAIQDDAPIDRDHLWWLHSDHRAIRRGNYKLVAAKGDRWELYNLSVDRSETNDLADGRPDLVNELSKLWQLEAEKMTRQVSQ